MKQIKHQCLPYCRFGRVGLTVLAAILALSFAGVAQANPSIRLRSGPDDAEQSPDSKDVAMSDRVSKIISSNVSLAKTNGDISVITTTDHLILLRGTVQTDSAHDRIMAALLNRIGAYQLKDDLVTVSS